MRAHEFVTKTGQYGKIATAGDYFAGELVDAVKVLDADDETGNKVSVRKITQVGGKKRNSNR
jgi:hypothetical protein